MRVVCRASQATITHVCGGPALSLVYTALRRLLCVFVLLTVTPAFSANVLLVDDDNNVPDVRGSYTTALDALGVSYDIWDTGDTDNEPGTAKLSGYDAVIWFTGVSYSAAAGPGASAETALAAYLDSSGCLFISSQDYHYVRGQTSLMTNYLGVSSITDDQAQLTVTGENHFSGLGLYSLSYPSSQNFSDVIIPPDPSVDIAFTGDKGYAAIYKETTSYRTTFWAFPFEAIPTSNDRKDAMQAVLAYCQPHVLVVDDDDNSPDVLSSYTGALNANGAGYHVWNTGNSDIEPDADILNRYPAVIWFTGDATNGAAGPSVSPGTEDELGQYLLSGGRLFIDGQDYLDDKAPGARGSIAPTAFMQTYLGIDSASNNVQQTTVTGTTPGPFGDVPPVYDALGPYSLVYPFTSNRSDAVVADTTAAQAFTGNQGSTAVYKVSGAYRTTFWGFPFEAIPTTADRSEAMQRVLTYLGPDTDGDNDVDTMDNCPWLANASQSDNDTDGRGDACDLDDDNDSVEDAADAFPLDPNEWLDTDGDGIGNNADPDDDNDSIADVTDNCDLLANLDQEDFDGDGSGDKCDPDDDGDGVDDAQDNCPLLINGNQLDVDTDGLGDDCDDVVGSHSINYQFERAWPTLQRPWYFSNPQRVAVSGDYVYVEDIAAKRISRLTLDGRVSTGWSIGPAEFVNFPGSIAVDKDGALYLSDGYNATTRIQRFSPDGEHDGEWPVAANFVTGLTLWDGEVYAAADSPNQVNVYDQNGALMRSWSLSGNPFGITVDHEGYIYVAYIDRIEKFAATGNGTVLDTWTTYACSSGTCVFSQIGGIGADIQGRIYIVDDTGTGVRMSSTGQTELVFGSYGTQPGQFINPRGVAVDRHGGIYVTDAFNARLSKFDESGGFITTWQANGNSPGFFHEPSAIVIDETDGSVYVADSRNDRIQKFDSDGRFPQVLGGDSNFGFSWPRGLAFDSTGNLVAINRTGNFQGKHYVTRFTTSGALVNQWGTVEGQAPGEFNQPWHACVDSRDYVYVADHVNQRVQKFSINGTLVDVWGQPGSGVYPVGIACDRKGFLYVVWQSFTSPVTGILQKVTTDGTVVAANGALGEARGVAVDGEGAVYVSREGSRVSKYTTSGTHLVDIGEGGTGFGQFSGADGLAIGNGGKIYVTDSLNHRIQVFRPELTPLRARAIVVAGGGRYDGNHLWNATQAMANSAYWALNYKGFNRDTIRYLSSNTALDLDGNGLADDVDADATLASIQQAITGWALADDDGDGNPDADDVVIYMTDHGGTDSFRVSATEMLTSSNLDGWLSTLEGAISGHVTVVYDACESGSFFSTPSSANRWFITSTAPGEAAYFHGHGLLSFSSFFWSAIFNGQSIGDAYSAAMGGLLFTPTPQSPLVDADGDGITNEGYDTGTGIPFSPPAGDYAVLQNQFIGTQTGSPVAPPVVTSASAVINQGSAGTISAGVTDAGGSGISRVWAVFYPPQFQPPSPENPPLDLPMRELVEISPGNYEASYSGFTTQGLYQVVISATDTLGNTSTPKVTSVSVGNPLTRRAVLVVGGQATDSDWVAREAMGTMIYQALRAQGYTDVEIDYLSATTVNGIEQLNTLANVQTVLTDSVMLATSQDLTLYMIGRSDGSDLTLNATETLPATTLDGWLDTLVTAIPGKLTVVMDADNAGFYLERLDLTQASGGSDFYRLASTIGGTAHFEGNGSVSYTRFFAGNVSNGATVPIAHLLAKQAMAAATSQQQQAWLDSNSDDTSDKLDISRILYYSLGPGILLAGDEPVIGNTGVDGFIASADPMAITPWADSITTTGTLAEVWALVTPPDTDGFGGSDPLPVKVPLTDNGTRYEAPYNVPTPLGGTYTVTFYAKDTDEAVSLPRTESLTREDDYEIDNTEAQASAIIVDDPAQYHSFHTVNDEDWVSFAATSGTTYTITADPTGAQADVVLLVKDPGGTVLTNPPVDDVPAGDHPLGAEQYIFTAAQTGAYTVQVSLDNTVSPPNLPSDYTLAVTTGGGGSGTTSVAGQVRDSNGNPVELAFVKIDGTGGTTGTASTLSVTPNGDYSIGDGPGDYILTALKSGYFMDSDGDGNPDPDLGTVVIPAQGTTIANIILTPDIPPDADGDGIPDASDPYPSNVDGDGDGLCDGPNTVSGVCVAGEDLNANGVVDSGETDPMNPDTDNDGFLDGDEVYYSSDPLLQTDTPANGDINDDGVVNVVDVLLATRIVMGQYTPSTDEAIRADVAPFNGSYPVPDGNFNAGDLVRIQRMAVGM